MMATFVDATVYMTCLSAKRKASGTTGFPSNNTSTNSTQVKVFFLTPFFLCGGVVVITCVVFYMLLYMML